MTGIETKGRSPFFPDQPVPVELFVGRASQIDHIMLQAVGQVAAGKPVTVYLEGEYGIGKTSVARYVQWMAERQFGLHGIYATLDRADTLDDVGAAILEATLRSGAYSAKVGEKLRNWLAKFVGEQNLFGVTVHVENLRREAPGIAAGLLPFLGTTLERLQSEGAKGIFLVMDEINGIADNPKFAHFLKGIVDSNAAVSKARPALPLLLLVCGVEERRRQIIAHHEPVGRIFDVVRIDRMDDREMTEFFGRAFASVHIEVRPEAMALLCEYAAGFPKIMHLIGNAAYWLDRDGVIDRAEALRAVLLAADEVGKRYVDQQVYAALRSLDYRSILAKIGKLGPTSMTFRKSEVRQGLSPTEAGKFDNFLVKMKKLGVLRSGAVLGEYVFNVRMVRFYLWLNSPEPAQGKGE